MAREKPADPLAWLEARGTVLLGDRAVKVLNDLYTEAAWLGACVARAQVGDVRKAATLQVDWEGWKPGDIDAARLLVADLDSNGLRELQERSGFVMRGINETRMTDLSNALSNAVGQGLSQSATASLIKEKVGGASRWANVVANTETRRAVTAATLDTYAAAGIEMKEWSTAGNAVDECKDFEDGGPIPLEAMWGDVSGPPAHPNCLCVVVPVLGVAAPVTPSEVVTLPDDVEVVTEGESVPTVAPIVEPDGFYPRDQWPQWAKDSGIANVIDELPLNRADIGITIQTKAEAIKDWEQKKSGTFKSLEDLEKAKIAAEKKIPKIEKERVAAENALQTYWDKNPDLRSRVAGMMDDNYVYEVQMDFPDYYRLKDDLVWIQRRKEALVVDLANWVKIKNNIADAKKIEPDWESTLVLSRKADIDKVTGAPGPVLKDQLDAVKRAGGIVEDEVQSRLPESMRGKPDKNMNLDEMKIIRDTRLQVISELRPMDTGEDMFRALTDSEAKAVGEKGYGAAKGASQEIIDLIKPSLDHYPTTWVDSMKAVNPEVKLLQTGRGYNQGGRTIAISGKGDRGLSTMVHEIGHSAERAVPGVKRLEWAELFNRSVKPNGKLPGLKSIYGGTKEKAFADHRFSYAYTGKLYASVKDQIDQISQETLSSYYSNFEVFTTGMQAAFPRTGDDVSYGDADGSFQRYILGILVTM